MTMTVSSVPVARSVLSNPAAIDKRATRTPTTPAIPTTTTDEDPRRCGMVAIPTLVTDHDCCPVRVEAIHKANNSTNASTTHHGDSVSKITGTTTATIMANPNPSFPMNEPMSATRQRIYDAQSHASHRRH